MTGLIRMTAKEHDKEGKTRVAAYCRVSTDKSEQQHSYEAQKKYFTQLYMNSESEELVRIYADSGSGTSMRYRPDLLRMLEDCRSEGLTGWWQNPSADLPGTQRNVSLSSVN